MEIPGRRIKAFILLELSMHVLSAYLAASEACKNLVQKAVNKSFNRSVQAVNKSTLKYYTHRQ